MSIAGLHGARSSAQQVFEKANAHYKKGDAKKAFELYKQIPEKNVSVLYNMGNSAYKLEKFGYALLYWRKAEQKWGMFDRFELLENIALLKEKVAQLHGLNFKKRSIIVRFFSRSKAIILSYLYTIPLFVLQFLFLLLWLFLFLYLRFLYKTKQRFLIVLLFSACAIIGALMMTRYGLNTKLRGIIVEKKVELRSGPSDYFQPLGNLFEADEVIVKKESDGFVKVKSKSAIGWIKKDSVHRIVG